MSEDMLGMFSRMQLVDNFILEGAPEKLPCIITVLVFFVTNQRNLHIPLASTKIRNPFLNTHDDKSGNGLHNSYVLIACWLHN